MAELNGEDWQQIALFYQRKFNDLELKVLAMELEMQKSGSQEEGVAPLDPEQAVSNLDE